MKITNVTGLPEPIVNALLEDDYTKGPSNRSITQLIDSPRVRIIRAEHPSALVEDVSEQMWRVLGKAVHKIFEDATGGAFLPEERLYLEHDDWIISGAIDIQESVDERSCKLADYKCTSVWSVIHGKIEWERQLNAYAWLVRKSKGQAVTELSIVTVLRDWQRREAEKREDYPVAPIVIVPVKLWTEEEQDNYMAERISIHQHAEFERITGGELPPCSDSERWMKQTTYAVKKKGNKRAINGGIKDSEAEAIKLIEDKGYEKTHIIETRPGEPTRCVGNYCGIAGICSQFQGEVWSA
jgi:hypothetical protein